METNEIQIYIILLFKKNNIYLHRYLTQLLIYLKSYMQWNEM